MAKCSAPYSVEMDADKARELAQQGATLLLLDVPAGTAIGIDHQMFLSGPKFCGAKMLPPGPHMLTYYAAGSSGAGFAAPTVRWMVLKGKEVQVLRWQPSVELLADLGDEDEEERYARGVRNFDFDAGLAPYNFAAYGAWLELADGISPETLERLLPTCVDISITAEARPAGITTAAEEHLDEQLRNNPARAAASSEGPGSGAGEASSSSGAAGSTPRLVGSCAYTEIPLRVHGEGLTPAEVTAANLDKSAALEVLIREKFGGSDAELMAEFKIAFLNFVMGHSLEGYAHWKDFLHLMCCCSAAAEGGGKLQALVIRFARALRCQLQITLEADPGGADGGGMSDTTPFGIPMVEELLSTSFLKPLLGNWIEDLMDMMVPLELQQEVKFIRAILTRRLGIQLDLAELGDEDDEYAPVVVEL